MAGVFAGRPRFEPCLRRFILSLSSLNFLYWGTTKDSWEVLKDASFRSRFLVCDRVTGPREVLGTGSAREAGTGGATGVGRTSGVRSAGGMEGGPPELSLASGVEDESDGRYCPWGDSLLGIMEGSEEDWSVS